MKTENIFMLVILGILAYLGFEIYKKKNPTIAYGNSVANQISNAFGGLSEVPTVETDTSGWQIPYQQPVYDGYAIESVVAE